nr:MAG: replication initiation protein [Microvirus Sku111]
MAVCLHPIKMFYNKRTKQYQINYMANECDKYNVIYVPCRHCEACEQNRINEFQMRVSHELESWNYEACFITLTVNDENMENVFPGRELQHRPFQLFMKRLRKELAKVGKKITYLMCGEYGAKYNRPHYHAVIFGWRPDSKDLTLIERKKNYNLSSSKTIAKCWKFGFNTVGTANIHSGSYLAKYVIKQTKDWNEFLYTVDDETGEIKNYKRPYLVYPRSAQNGGLGYRWYRQNCKEIFEQGYIQGSNIDVKQTIPRYYKRKFEEEFPELYKIWKQQAQEKAKEQVLIDAEKEGVLVTANDILRGKFKAFKLLDNPALGALEVLKDKDSWTGKYQVRLELEQIAFYITSELLKDVKINHERIALENRRARKNIKQSRQAFISTLETL